MSKARAFGEEAERMSETLTVSEATTANEAVLVDAGPRPARSPHVAVLIPCYNEELTIAAVVQQFRAELPDAAIYVFDNNSTDRTVAEAEAARALNRLGNRLFLSVLNSTFKVQITDMLSGYRAFSRAFVKSVPLFGGGFETETELTIKALERGFRIVEVPCDLTSRPEGSFSKIRIAHDGVRILSTILALFRDYKPLTFFGAIGLVLVLLGFI